MKGTGILIPDAAVSDPAWSTSHFKGLVSGANWLTPFFPFRYNCLCVDEGDPFMADSKTTNPPTNHSCTNLSRPLHWIDMRCLCLLYMRTNSCQIL